MEDRNALLQTILCLILSVSLVLPGAVAGAASTLMYTVRDHSAFLDPVHITNEAGNELYPDQTGDGQYIVMCSNRDGGWGNIWRSDADGTNFVRLTNIPIHIEEYRAWHPVLHPAGNFVYYMDDPNYWFIARTTIDGTGTREEVLRIPAYDVAGRLSLSPDGSRFAFVYYSYEENRGLYARRDIIVANSDGSSLGISYSRDRMRNELSIYRDDDIDMFHGGIEWMNTSVAWSPDGNRIYFPRRGTDGVVSIYSVSIDGTNLARITPPALGHCTWPALSPDGTRIAVQCQADDQSDHELFLMLADGSNAIRLTSNDYEDRFPAWSYDGSSIIYSSNPSGDYDLYMIVLNVPIGLAVSPQEARIVAGESQPYTAEATDGYGERFDVTDETAFAIESGAGGVWVSNTYTSQNEGEWIVTGTYEGITDTAILVVESSSVWFSLTTSSTAGGSVASPGEGAFTYAEGTVVDLAATPTPGHIFANWTGDTDTIADVSAASTTITMNCNCSVIAVFEEDAEEEPEMQEGCFIATAAYGTPMAGELQILRKFRDGHLLTNRLGRAFTGLYYRTSPPIAGLLDQHPALKPMVRVGLLPALAMSTVVVNTTPAEKTALVGLLVSLSVTLAVWATSRGYRATKCA